MAFSATSETTNGIAKITLTGELDASAAPEFKAAIEKVAAENPRRVVLLAKQLEYMASAGLRVLIFAKQKLGNQVEIFVVGAPPTVVETLEVSGFHYSVTLMDDYDPARIEA
jgi:anti-anti-sigma factor